MNVFIIKGEKIQTYMVSFSFMVSFHLCHTFFISEYQHEQFSLKCFIFGILFYNPTPTLSLSSSVSSPSVVCFLVFIIMFVH